MLRLPDPTLIFKNAEVDDFLKAHGRGMEFLESFLTSPTMTPVLLRLRYAL
jgi:hypothetical protein